MPRLTEQEQQEIVRFIEADKPLPDKYRLLLFEEKTKRVTATLREQQAEATKPDSSIEPFGSRIHTWLPFPATLAP